MANTSATTTTTATTPNRRAMLARAISTQPALAAYLDEARAYPDLSWAQERELGATMRAGTQPGKPRTPSATAARQRLIESNLRLVVSIAKGYAALDGSNLTDLISEGTIGLCVAVDKYDPTRRCRFSTHATQWIRREVQRAAVAASVPGGMHHSYEQARTQQYEADETPLSLDSGPLAETMATDGVPMPDTDDAGDDVAAGAVSDNPRVRALQRHLALLSATERGVVTLRFGLRGEHLSLPETATRLGLHISQVRRIEAGAMEKMRGAFGLAGNASAGTMQAPLMAG